MKKDLFEELKKYGESDFYPFHMPGHKRNINCGPFSEMFQIDITEIDGFDNLHQPEGIIKEAQERAAFLYHSRETYFLVNGSTAGILTAVSAVACRGRKLIIARNCHRAVYHSAFLNHLELEYIYPEIIKGFGLSDGIRAEQVEEKIREIAGYEKIDIEQAGSVIAGIVITSPTYDGILSDVRGIVKTAHSYGIPVIVDQAHGAHFGFHPSFPVSAVAEGADFVIHSVHKTLPSPTQTALLHHNSSYVSSETVRKYLRIYQSSSPSYPLMAGIDRCMEFLEKEGKEALEKLLFFRRKFLEETGKLSYIKVYPSMAEEGKGGQDVSESFEPGMAEPGRLLIFIEGMDYTGQQLYDTLRESYHLQMEMCAPDYVTAILSVMDRQEGFERLAKALTETDRMLAQKKSESKRQEKEIYLEYQQYQPEAAYKISDVFAAEGEYVPLEEAEGRIASDFINLYPPGIPVVVPGEKIDHKIIAMIEAYLKEGYTVQGVEKDRTNIAKSAKVRVILV